MRLRIENLVQKDVDKVAQGGFNTHQIVLGTGNADRQHRAQHRHIVTRLLRLQLTERTQQVGVGLNDVKMGVLRLGIVGIKVRQAHVGNGLPVTCTSLYVAVVLRIKGVLLDAVEKLQGILQRLTVARGTGILGESVDGEPYGIELLLRVERIALVINAPIDAAVFRVDEVVDEVVLGTGGGSEVSPNSVLSGFVAESSASGTEITIGTRGAEYAIGCRERPEDAGIQYSTLLGLRMQHAPPVHATIEAAVLAVLHLVKPETQDVVL